VQPHTVVVPHSDEQCKVCLFSFLVFTLTGIFGHVICNIVCIYLYIYVARQMYTRSHTPTWTRSHTHASFSTQSKRGNLVFLFDGVRVPFAQMYCVTFCTS